MTWAGILALAGGAYALKALGVIGLGRRPLPARIEAVAPLIPVALLSALIVVQTLSTGHELVFDARLPGIAVAALAVMLRAPFPLVITLAAAVTAVLRGVA